MVSQICCNDAVPPTDRAYRGRTVGEMPSVLGEARNDDTQPHCQVTRPMCFGAVSKLPTHLEEMLTLVHMLAIIYEFGRQYLGDMNIIMVHLRSAYTTGTLLDECLLDGCRLDG